MKEVKTYTQARKLMRKGHKVKVAVSGFPDIKLVAIKSDLLEDMKNAEEARGHDLILGEDGQPTYWDIHDDTIIIQGGF